MKKDEEILAHCRGGKITELTPEEQRRGTYLEEVPEETKRMLLLELPLPDEISPMPTPEKIEGVKNKSIPVFPT